MPSFPYLLYAQAPAVLVLSLLCFAGYLRTRRAAAVRSVLWVVAFALTLSASLTFFFLGISRGFWSLSTFFPMPGASWVGLGALALLTLLAAVRRIERKRQAVRLDKALRQAEAQKQAEVARAREEGAAAARAEAESEAYFADDGPAVPPEA